MTHRKTAKAKRSNLIKILFVLSALSPQAVPFSGEEMGFFWGPSEEVQV